SFFHRVLVQEWNAPFRENDTAHHDANLPPLSPTHIMTSFEPLLAFSAYRTGINPLRIYQVFTPLALVFLWTITYAALYKQFRLSNFEALFAFAGIFVFLFLERNLHRSFGNVSLLRLWQGKIIMWAVLTPMTLYFALRFMLHPTFKTLGLVMFANISAVGLSGSGIFMSPILICAVSLAYVLSFGFERKNLERAFLLNLASFYTVAVALTVMTGILPSPQDTAVWDAPPWEAQWWKSQLLVLGAARENINDALLIFRDFGLVLVVPLLIIRIPLNRLLTLLTIALIAIFANPLTGSFFLKLVYPGSYWRLAYLFPMPLCAGLTAVLLMRIVKLPPRQSIVNVLVFAMVVVTTYKGGVTVIAPEWKSPLALQFPPAAEAFVQQVSDDLTGANVLAPEEIAWVLGLYNPGVRFETGRAIETRHVFSNAGYLAEGERRVEAQKILNECRELTPENQRIIHASLANGVDTLMFRDCSDAFRDELRTLLSGSGWHEEMYAVEEHRYYLITSRSACCDKNG
ncbi:MAG TPA: DUF6077 domain-containing protein, partial [Aggregatilineales bacterium]|nr:DUF6077 domain-containing protein [Aggregatilineales bacterium]